LIGTGRIAIVNAAINAVLQIIEPMAFPYAIAPLLFIAAVTDTITSGRVVPIDTTVAPIISSGIRKRLAIPTELSTKRSPPFISSTAPTTNKIRAPVKVSFSPLYHNNNCSNIN
jgi:hypothetical protein